jgi:hypothetical protein
MSYGRFPGLPMGFVNFRRYGKGIMSVAALIVMADLRNYYRVFGLSSESLCLFFG